MSLFASILLLVWAAVLALWEGHAAFASVPPWTHGLRTVLIAAFVTGALVLQGVTP
jgi:hypothetical protein